MASYVDVETPKEIQDKALQALEMAKDTGRIRKGINEATKAVEKGTAILVVIAEDVDPPEVVMHLPMICREKGTSYVFIAEKKLVGRSAGLEVPCSAIAIEKAGSAQTLVEEIVAKLGTKKKPEKKEEKPAETTAAAPAEEKKKRVAKPKVKKEAKE